MLDVFGLFKVDTLYVVIGLLVITIAAIVLAIVATTLDSKIPYTYTKKKPFTTPFLRQKMSYKRRSNTPPKWQRNTIKKYSVRFTENTSGAYSKIMRLILMTSS